jgi:hypothetical protein
VSKIAHEGSWAIVANGVPFDFPVVEFITLFRRATPDCLASGTMAESNHCSCETQFPLP